MAADMKALQLTNVSKSYGDTAVLHNINVSVAEAEFVSLLGPSGCGKTTTLNLVSGFVQPDSGRILLRGKDITDAPPYRRDTAVVFQNYALFPHMRVADNVAYGLRAKKLAKKDIGARVEQALVLVGITELASRYPSQLSGGQQQRVAVARAVATRPQVLLMDEPLSNLDAKLRADIRNELRELQRELGQAVLFVTHDQEEALSLSDRVVVMNGGRIEQIGSPAEVFERPSTVFVADFMGIENIISGHRDGSAWVSTNGLSLMLPSHIRASCLGIRPSAVRIGSVGVLRTGHDEVSVEGTVASSAYLGDTVRYIIRVGPEEIIVAAPSRVLNARPGDRVAVAISAQDILPLDGPLTDVAPVEAVETRPS